MLKSFVQHHEWGWKVLKVCSGTRGFYYAGVRDSWNHFDRCILDPCKSKAVSIRYYEGQAERISRLKASRFIWRTQSEPNAKRDGWARLSFQIRDTNVHCVFRGRCSPFAWLHRWWGSNKMELMWTLIRINHYSGAKIFLGPTLRGE